jgi:DNA-binding transcriptional MerR regulator
MCSEVNSPDYVTLTEAEALTYIPKETIKRYMRNHDDFVRFKKDGRVYYVSADSIETLKQIRVYYNEGFRKERVSELLENEGYPVTISYNSNENETGIVSVNEELQQMRKLLKTLVQQMDSKDNQIMELHNKLDESNKKIEYLQEYLEKNTNKTHQEITSIKQEVNAKDKEIMLQMNKMLEEKAQEVAAAKEAEEKEKKKNWIARLFGKK